MFVNSFKTKPNNPTKFLHTQNPNNNYNQQLLNNTKNYNSVTR